MQPNPQLQPQKNKTPALAVVMLILIIATGLAAYKHSANQKLRTAERSSNSQQPIVVSGPYAGSSLYKLVIKDHKLISPKAPLIVKQGQPLLIGIISNSRDQENFYVTGQGGLSVEVEPDDLSSQAFLIPTKLGTYSFGLSQDNAPYTNFGLGQLKVVTQ